MSKNDNSSTRNTGKPAPEGSGPKKPSALLDLKATEVSSSENKPSAPAGMGGGASATAPASATATPSAGSKAPEPASSSSQTGKPAASTVPSESKSGAPSSSGASSGATAAPKSTEPAKAVGSVPPVKGGGAAKPAESPTAGQKSAGTQSANPAPEQESKTAPQPKSSGGGFGRLLSHLAAGVVGGFLALLLADSLGPRFGLSTGTPPVVSELQQRLTTAEQAIRERPTAQTATAAVEQKLADVETRLARLDEINRAVSDVSEAQARLSDEAKALGERIGQGPSSEVTERIAKLEQLLATLTAAAGSEEPGRIPQLAAITGKLADLEATIPNQLSELRKSLSEEVETRLAQSAEASEAARSATLRMDRELAAAKTDIARLSQRAEAQKATDDRLEQTLRAVQEEAGSLRSGIDGLKSELASQLKSVARAQDVTAAVAPVEGRISALEQSVQGVVKSEEDRRSNAERIVLALELGNLKRALDRGGSYAAELSEVSKIGAGKIDLKALERYRDQGVPTQADLVREFRPVAHAVIDAASVPADASTLDRLLLGAKSVVRVRRTEHRPDDKSVEAIVARMEDALADGKLADVLSEAQQLPPKAAEPAEGWLAKVEARAAVDRALASVEDQLKASLSGKAPVEKRTQ